MKNCYLLIICVLFVAEVSSQNLIINPSAELGDPATVGWNSISMGSTGASCYNNTGWRILGNQSGFPAAQQGSYFFFAGCSPTNGLTFELRQDISVLANASIIDLGWDAFTFSGYMQVYAQSPPDKAQMIVEYRNAANTIVLGSYNTGLTSNQGVWTFYSNTTSAPVGTRIIRIRLLAVVNTGPSIDAYFDNLSLTTNIPLAVVFSAFNVVPENTDVKLTWTTSSENNNSYFTVQRSLNATDWDDVEKVRAGNNTNYDTTYIASDNNPLPGVSYYRLKITDNSGNVTYSEIKEINFGGSFAGVNIFPNPAKSFFNVTGNDLKNTQVSVYNNLGQLINLSHTAQSNSITFNVAGLPKGIYYVRLNNAQTTEVRKILIE
ncbi:MAG TPA: T9SS type A sorting domain-containing protein [Puia sp.]